MANEKETATGTTTETMNAVLLRVEALERQFSSLQRQIAEMTKPAAAPEQGITTVVKPQKAKGNTVSVKTDNGNIYQITFVDGVVTKNQFRRPTKPNEVISLDALMGDSKELSHLLNYALQNPSAGKGLYSITELTNTKGG